SFPLDSKTYGAGDWTGSITGTASDGSSGVQQVMVSILQASTGLYWDGQAFASDSPVFLPATGTTDWSFSFPASIFPSTVDDYLIESQATDLAGNVEPQGTGFNMSTIHFTG